MLKKVLLCAIITTSFSSAEVFDSSNFNSNGSEHFCNDVIPTTGVQLHRIRFRTPLMCVGNTLFSAQVSGMVIPNNFTETNHMTPIANLGYKCYCNHDGKIPNAPKGMIIDYNNQWKEP